jgi:amino acid permease
MQKSSYQRDVEGSEDEHLLSSWKGQHEQVLVIGIDKPAQYLCLFIPISWIFTFDDKVSEPSNSSFWTMFLLLNAMIGSGILAQAYVFYQAGWLAAAIEYLIIGFLTYTGASFLIEAAVKVNIYSYAELCEHALGSNGKILVEVSVIANNFGCLLSYLLIIGSLLHSVVESVVGHSAAWYTSSIALMLFVSIFIIWPLCLIRVYGHLVVVSTISITAIVVVVLLVTIGGPLTSTDDDSSMTILSLDGILDSIGSIIFAFGYTAIVFHSYNAMSPQKPELFNQVAKRTTLIGGSMCFLVGIVGAYSFQNNTKADILENFSGVLGTIFQLIVIVHLLLYIPGDYLVMRSSLMNLMGRDVRREPNMSYLILSLSLLAIVTLIASILLRLQSDSLALVLDLTGGIAGCMINFLIPGFVARQILWEEDTSIRWKIRALIVAGLLIPLFVIYGSVI